MGFEIKVIQSNKTLASINNTRDRYQEFYEGIIENNTYEGQYLQELLQLEKDEPGRHQETIHLQQAVFDKGEESALNFKQKIKRMDDIAAQKNIPSFCIPKETTKAEIKTLMNAIKYALENTQDPAKIQFLTIVSETAETCKDKLSNGEAFDDQYIPLLTSEYEYGHNFINSVTNERLDHLSDDSNFLSTIKEVYNQAVNSKNILGLMDKEHHFMKALQAEIEHVINAGSPSLQDTSERLKEALHTKINALLENDSTTNNFFSERFKQFINHVCQAINIVSPFSTAAKAKQDIIDTFKELKQLHQDNTTKLLGNETPSPNIEEAENTEQNTFKGP